MKNMSFEKKYLPDPDYHPPQSDDVYVSMDADVTKPIRFKKSSHFPKIGKSRFGEKLQTMTLDERRSNKKLTIRRMHKKLKLPTHLSNFSLA